MKENVIRAGFCITTTDELEIEINAEDHGIELNGAKWAVLNEDTSIIEKNALHMLQGLLSWAREEGHSGSNNALVGSCEARENSAGGTFVKEHEEDAIEPARKEENPALYKGVSVLGRDLVDVYIEFFNIQVEKNVETGY